jgi:hypothetical protein
MKERLFIEYDHRFFCMRRRLFLECQSHLLWMIRRWILECYTRLNCKKWNQFAGESLYLLEDRKAVSWVPPSTYWRTGRTFVERPPTILDDIPLVP